jgi:hypothetical protein
MIVESRLQLSFAFSVPELLGFEFRRSHLQVKEVGKQLG